MLGVDAGDDELGEIYDTKRAILRHTVPWKVRFRNFLPKRSISAQIDFSQSGWKERVANVCKRVDLART